MKYRRSEYCQGNSDLNQHMFFLEQVYCFGFSANWEKSFGVKDGPSMDMFFQREIMQHSIGFMN
jgi:hypothetical protein